MYKMKKKSKNELASITLNGCDNSQSKHERAVGFQLVKTGYEF